ncbi:UBN2 domain-containing protein, partial [Cephalotus follicularis]
ATSKLKENESSISTYLQQAKYIANELAAAGKCLSYEEFNVIIFNSLGPSFHHIIIAISIRETPVLFPELHNLLISEEIPINSLTPNIDLPSANTTHRQFKTEPHNRSTI